MFASVAIGWRLQCGGPLVTPRLCSERMKVLRSQEVRPKP